jgi:PKD repeat protein
VGGWGIYLRWNTRQHVVEANDIANALDGGVGLLEHNVKQVRISRNIITNTDGPPIYLTPDPVNPSTGANDLLPPPTLSVSTVQASGTGIAGATVEVYRASRPAGEVGLPVEYLGSTTVGGNGQWALAVAIGAGDRLSALQIRTDGTTSTMSTNVAAGGPPQAPSASFDWSQAAGSLRIDFSDTSSGAPTSWSWDFGDGNTSTQPSPSHTYAAEGDYTVSLTVGNPSGSDTHTATVSVSAVDPGTTIAADGFGRSVAGGWGSADIGGSYSLLGNTASFSVGGGAGQIVLPAGASRRATLDGAPARDVDLLVRVRTDKPASNGSHYIYLVARRNGDNAYRPKLIVAPNGQVSVHAGIVINNAESSLGPAVVVPGLSPATGWTWLRAQVVGAAPTTIRVKAWADGSAEPSFWQFEATNSHAALQDVGGVGVNTYMSSSVNNAPVTFSFDDFLATTPTPPPPPPAGVVAADEFERNASSGWGVADVGAGYSHEGPLANFGVSGGVGTMLLPNAGVMRSALLDAPNSADIDILFRVSADKSAAGGTWFVYSVARRNGGSEYRPRILLRPDGSVAVHASRVLGNSESPLGSPVTVAGLSHSAGSYIWFRAQVEGSDPTTIRVRAWAAGSPEPAVWHYSVTDASSALQGPGGVGLRVYISGSTANAPVNFAFDDYLVSDLP